MVLKYLKTRSDFLNQTNFDLIFTTFSFMFLR